MYTYIRSYMYTCVLYTGWHRSGDMNACKHTNV